MKRHMSLVARAIMLAAPMLAMRALPCYAEVAEPLGALAKMPVKEITVFKDGHAFVLHSGMMPTDAGGNVVMDYLPQPVLGTFWPYAGEKSAGRLSAVTSSQRKVLVERTAMTVRDLLEANPGAEVLIKEHGATNPYTGGVTAPGAEYFATIVGIPQRSADELEATSPPNTGPFLPQKAGVIMLKTNQGSKVVDISRIEQVTFKGDYKKTIATEELRNLLTMKLEWKSPVAKEADVGMVYLQKGIRWIPNYRVNIDGKGEATVKLQATLINELTDLQDVTTNLVVGVPSFAFKDTRDPIALEQAVAQLSQHFQPDARSAYAFSNAIASQVADGRESARVASGGGPSRPMDLGPEVTGSKKNEDLYVFTVSHVTLKKGARMVLPVTEFKLKYRDVYTLDIPFTPPPEVFRAFNTQQQAEIARILGGPKFAHKLRLVNKSDYPLTTAPALILRDGKLIAQSMMTYTAVGGEGDLSTTTAVDIKVTKSDREKKRTPKDEIWEGDAYTRVDCDGTIKITNHRGTPAELEITRGVLGQIDKADNDGKVEMFNVFEDNAFLPTNYDPAQYPYYPHWWGWYSWPYWWGRFNGIGKVNWKLTLEPDKTAELNYQWHYHWR